MSAPLANEPAVGPEGGAAELARQLRATIRKMELALGAIGDGIVWADATGAIEWCNDTFERAAGRPRILLLGASIFDHLQLRRGAEPLQRQDHPVQVALASGSSALAMYRWHGHDRWIEVSATRSGVGAAATAIVAIRDVTERTTLQEEVRRKGEQLEDQLAHLAAADRMKSEFLANMSHELRTPLNGIVGFSELIHDGRAGELTPKQQAYAANILRSGRHLLALIDGILELANVHAGRLEVTLAPVDLTVLVSEVVDAQRSASDEKGLRLEVVVSAELGRIVVDAKKLRQVLSSYVSNAVKFTPAGGLVRIACHPRGPDRFRLEVSDSGPGIARADHTRLFVEFEQLDGGSTKLHQGAGLGLALAKRLVEAQGGVVGVESAPGRGSTFFAELPRVVQVPAPAAPVTSAPAVTRGG